MANWKTLQTMNPTRAKQKITAPTDKSTDKTAKMGPDRTTMPKPNSASQPTFRNTTQVESRFSMMTTPVLEEYRLRSPATRENYPPAVLFAGQGRIFWVLAKKREKETPPEQDHAMLVPIRPLMVLSIECFYRVNVSSRCI